MLEINLQWLNEKLDSIQTDIRNLHPVNRQLGALQWIGWIGLGMLLMHIIHHW